MACQSAFTVLAVCFLFHTTAGVLRQLHVVFRHGERTPASTYPNDPYINETFQPYGWGQLTNEGKINPYKQGQWLRANYGEFIGDQYSEQLVEVHTTEVDRAQMTTQLTMAGLFPPVGDQIWNKELLWQPIPMKMQPLQKDRLMLTRGCQKFNELLNEVLNLPDVKSTLAKEKDLYEYLTTHAGTSVKTPYDVEDIYSTLKAEEGLNLVLPEWTQAVYPEKMENVAARSFLLNTYTNELKRLKGGPLLKKILSDSQAKVSGNSNKKLYVYSGHDATVANLLSALGSWEQQMPTYNAMAIFELYQTDSDHYLKVMYRNSSTEAPHELKIPNCPDPCSLTKVLEVVAPVLPDDLDKECGAVNSSDVAMPDAVQP